MVHLQVTTGDSRPIFRQIVDGIRVAIAGGELAPGDKLPSVRGLAMHLTVNTNTVAKAYAELTAEGLIDSQAGVGLFVAPPRQRLSAEERERRLCGAIDHFVGAVATLGYDSEDVLARLRAVLDDLLARDARPSTSGDPHA
jgi:GntR family transcriptional regulator